MSAKQLFGVAAVCAIAVTGATGFARADDKAIDDEGFIRAWLVLAPIPLGRMGRRLQEIADMAPEQRPVDLYAALAEVAR